MSWFNDKFSAEPIECPRGWGEVSFVLKFVLVPPIFVIGRRCPIGGVEQCKDCRYQVNPVSTDLLRVGRRTIGDRAACRRAHRS